MTKSLLGSLTLAATAALVALAVAMPSSAAVASKGGEFKEVLPEVFEEKLGFYFRSLEEVAVPNMQRLQRACRKAKIEVMYSMIQSLTKDGRDRSLDYKIFDYFVARGSWEARVLDALAPLFPVHLEAL